MSSIREQVVTSSLSYRVLCGNSFSNRSSALDCCWRKCPVGGKESFDYLVSTKKMSLSEGKIV